MRILLLFLILIHGHVFAEMDASGKDALKKTQDMLKDKDARDAAIKKDPKAKDADAKAGALAGSEENKDEMYNLAAELMEKIATESNGDPEKMQKLMQEAQANPEAFFKKYFSADQKKRVHNLANKIDKDKPGVGPSK
jgi:hypothetical protein